MIFRTIDTDAKKLTERFGFLNKSFRDIKKDSANGLGVKSSLFQTSISKTDYQALQKFNSAIKVTNDGLTKSQRITKAWNENMADCSMAAKKMGNDLVTGKKNIQDVSNAMNTAAASTKAFGIAMNVIANVGFMLIITAITKVIFELAQAQSNAVQTANEATEAYKSELNSIADYKERLSVLHKELKSENLSYEETKAKRTELLSIQDELIKKFGNEKDTIESVTKAINGQTGALDELSEKAYRNWLAKADEQTFWNKLLPWGKSGLDQAIDYMETEKTVSFMDMQNANLSDELQAVQKEIDETIRKKYNLDKTFAMFNVTGTPDEIRTQLENIRQDYVDISNEIFGRNEIPNNGMWKEYRKEAIDSINEAILSLDDGLEKHQQTYQTYIEGMIKYDSEYSDEYANILEKRAELEAAENSGDTENIQKAKQGFMDAISNGIEASGSNKNIKKYFQSLYPELQAEFANWTFEFALNANEKGLKDIAKEIGEKYTAVELLNMVNTEGVQEGEESFNSLIDKAIEYGVCTDKSAEEVQKLIDLLVKLGIVQGDIKNAKSVYNNKPLSFKEAWKLLDNPDGESFKNLKQNLLELAKAGKLTVEEFNKTPGAKTWVTEIGISAEEAVNRINKLREVSSSDQLVSMGNGIKSLSDNLTSKKESPKQAISYDTLAGMSDELKECTVQWKKYEKVMGIASSTYEDCSKVTDELATAFVNSNNFLANLTASTKQYYISQLSAMGVSNAEEIVTAVLAQRHREAAAAKQAESLKNEVLAITKNGVTNETLKEVSMLFQQEHATKLARYALVDLIAQEQILSNTSLSFDDKISSLNTLATQYLGVAAAASFMSKVQTSSEGALSSGETITVDEAWSQTISEQQKALSQPVYIPPAVTVSPSFNYRLLSFIKNFYQMLDVGGGTMYY